MAGKSDHLTIKLRRHDNIMDCLAEYFNCPFQDIPTEGYWDFMDAEGNRHRTPQEEAIGQILGRRVWAWVENKKVIHFYASERATMEEIIEVMAHEIGHIERPYHKTLKEERKACKYARVALAAWQMADKIKSGGNCDLSV